MRIVTFLLILCFYFSLFHHSLAQDRVELRFSEHYVCETQQVEVEIFIRSASTKSINIGTSSIYLTYNPSAIAFDSYRSISLDENTRCNGLQTGVWAKHAVDGLSKKGAINITLILNEESTTSPTIRSDQWTALGRILFKALNLTGGTALSLVESLSGFNQANGNDGRNPVFFSYGKRVTGRITPCPGPKITLPGTTEKELRTCSIFPNPATRTLIIAGFNTNEGNYTISILHPLGGKLMEVFADLPKGKFEYPLNIEFLEAGAYLLRISSGDEEYWSGIFYKR